MRQLLRQLLDAPVTAQPDKALLDTLSQALDAILDPDSNGVMPTQVAALLTWLRVTRHDRHVDVLTLLAQKLRQHSNTIDNDRIRQRHPGAVLLDIVGTGGDGLNTFNASTTAAVVVAGCSSPESDIVVVKASSSQCGSADLLIAAGCLLETLGATQVPTLLDESNFCFLFAQNFHPSMKNIAPIRKELGFPTIFNLMGPLLNPVLPDAMVVGVNSVEIARTYAQVLHAVGVKRALVVRGREGLDEISPTTTTDVFELSEDGTIREYTVEPKDFGIDAVTVESICGGDPKVNLATFVQLLDQKLPETHPIVSFVLVNAAALLKISGKATSFLDGMAMAKAALYSGRARHAFNAFQQALQSISKNKH